MWPQLSIPQGINIVVHLPRAVHFKFDNHLSISYLSGSRCLSCCLKHCDLVLIADSVAHVYNIIPSIMDEINHFFMIGKIRGNDEMRGLAFPAFYLQVCRVLTAKKKIVTPGIVAAKVLDH
jgi:hypothetical protein